MADWKDVGRAVARVAPVLAGVLGGPVGAVAGAAGALVASWLGTEADPQAVQAALAADPQAMIRLKELELAQQERLLAWQERQLAAETEFERSLTGRHTADAASDSWLSKNVRPLCLLVFTLALVGGTFAPQVDGGKLDALAELGFGVYGYYFLGRSAFDKGAVRLRWGRGSAGR
ncbi:hypothetical protein [Desulfocurvus sp.]|jgi:hypothetical protein|uniref:hypothetical protein n=1 Tax=Desulfocurvus sp. TaxID=2871698 RepID=UPI0025C6D374|nr:hypothetical protein [Desulfocurvus sp.]MCK9239402.1 hypothetical protein [Desulfocurvus sp.]